MAGHNSASDARHTHLGPSKPPSDQGQLHKKCGRGRQGQSRSHHFGDVSSQAFTSHDVCVLGPSRTATERPARHALPRVLDERVAGLQELVLLIKGGPKRRRLLAVVDLTDPAVVKAALAAAASSVNTQYGAGATHVLSNAKLTAAATGISNANTLATSATSASVSTLPITNPASCSAPFVPALAPAPVHMPAPQPCDAADRG